MENLIEKIRNKKFSFARMHPAMNLDQEVVRLCDIEEIFSSQLEPLVMPKIADENYKRGLQFGIDYCDTQMNILQKIHKDQPVTSLKAIQKYLDVKKQLVNERDSNFSE